MDTLDRQDSHPKLLLIAGLQKSGTTLLQRLLVDHTAVASSPFTGVEGHDFWGNVPSHAPRGFPAGTFYASHQGDLGHEIPATYANRRVCRVLRDRFARLPVSTAVIVNKNPYHTVRLPWLKAVFPNSFIVATVRHAVPNIFSLLKKHVRQDEHDRPWREERWYGVKPRGWRSLLNDDTLLQCASQWRSVMSKLWSDRSHVDLFVEYRQLCQDPAAVVRQILRAVCEDSAAGELDLPAIRCYDDECHRGGPLRSKNEVAQLAPLNYEPIELPPFSPKDVARYSAYCAEVVSRFDSLFDRQLSPGTGPGSSAIYESSGP